MGEMDGRWNFHVGYKPDTVKRIIKQIKKQMVHVPGNTDIRNMRPHSERNSIGPSDSIMSYLGHRGFLMLLH